MAMETESSAPAHLLLGPPVIRGARPSADATEDGALVWHPFLDLLDTRRRAPFGRCHRQRCTGVAPHPRPSRHAPARALRSMPPTTTVHRRGTFLDLFDAAFNAP
jgi:hypothetical protein